MIRVAITLADLDLSIPRESGDDPKANEAVDAAKKYSPRERG